MFTYKSHLPVDGTVFIITGAPFWLTCFSHRPASLWVYPEIFCPWISRIISPATSLPPWQLILSARTCPRRQNCPWSAPPSIDTGRSSWKAEATVSRTCFVQWHSWSFSGGPRPFGGGSCVFLIMIKSYSSYLAFCWTAETYSLRVVWFLSPCKIPRQLFLQRADEGGGHIWCCLPKNKYFTVIKSSCLGKKYHKNN